MTHAQGAQVGKVCRRLTLFICDIQEERERNECAAWEQSDPGVWMSEWVSVCVWSGTHSAGRRAHSSVSPPPPPPLTSSVVGLSNQLHPLQSELLTLPLNNERRRCFGATSRPVQPEREHTPHAAPRLACSGNALINCAACRGTQGALPTQVDAAHDAVKTTGWTWRRRSGSCLIKFEMRQSELGLVERWHHLKWKHKVLYWTVSCHSSQRLCQIFSNKQLYFMLFTKRLRIKLPSFHYPPLFHRRLHPFLAGWLSAASLRSTTSYLK